MERMRNLARIPLFPLIVLLISATFPYPIIGSPSTTLYVHPSQRTVVVGQTFVIDIKISDVTNLYGWEFKLAWNPSILDVDEISEGPFLRQAGSTFFLPEINNTQGYVHVTCTLLGEVPGVNGSGTLASVTFYAENEGISILYLFDTKLSDSLAQPIPHTAEGGNVIVSSSQPVGGTSISVDRFALLAPWIRTVLTVLFSLIIIIVLTKYQQQKHKLPVSHVNAPKGTP